MSHALVTMIAPLALDRIAMAEAAIDRLGHPAGGAIEAALGRLDGDGSGTHFASLHAIASADGARGYIVLEFSADGTEDGAPGRVVAGVGEQITPILAL